MIRLSMYFFYFSLVVLQGCTQQKSTTENSSKLALDPDFGSYWYQGKAELTSYDLQQVRYGEKRQGNAVLVFVTEDFSGKKQVKLDNPSATPGDAEKVLKLNFTKKFNTGIYPYSMMSSVFSPVYPETNQHALKVTTSVQEWCGHVFMQFNRQEKGYQSMIRSYFESEGDQDFELPMVYLEDELWNLIRLDPSSIPTGDIKVIPSTMYLRLKHRETKPYRAVIERTDTGEESSLRLTYADLDRTLTISYQSKFPYQINGWEESYPENGTLMITRGTLDQRILSDYWTKNSEADSVYREELGLR